MATTDDKTITQTITVGGKTFKVTGTVNLAFEDVTTTTPPPPTTDPSDPTKPSEFTVKEGGWGASMDPTKWIRTSMKDDPKLFKVTDGSKNVATHFTTGEAADNFIKFFQRHPDQISVLLGSGGGSSGGDGGTTPPIPGGGGNTIPPNAVQDAQGVVMIYKPKQGGQVVTADQTIQKESDHNTGSRTSLYSKDPYSASNGEITEYFVMDLSDNGEQNAPKLLSGGHTGSGDSDETRQGRCYAVGINQNGSMHLAKEYPHHPVTPKAYDKIQYVDPNWKSLGDIRNKFVGMKIIYFQVEKAGGKKGVHIEWWFDVKTLETGKKENDWRQCAFAEDFGDWGDKFGEPYLENNGVKFNGKVLGFYIRIDTPKKPVQFSHQGQHELEVPIKKLV